MEGLNFLIGTWKTQGKVRADGATPEITFNGTDSYEWILNRKFILHKVDVMMGNEKTEAVEIIGGYNVENKTYHMRSFDNRGTVMEMEAHIDKQDVLHIVGSDMRSKLTRRDENTLIAHWERLAENQTWVAWMDLQLSK